MSSAVLDSAVNPPPPATTAGAPPDRVSRWLSPLLPRRPLSPNESFQARFLAGGNLLGLLVAIPSVAGEILNRQWLPVAFIGAFALASVAQVLALRLGAPLRALVWTALGVLALFLTAISLVTIELQPAQGHWLLLLPIASMVLVDPRTVRSAHLPSRSTPLLVSLGALALGLFIIAAHELGWTFGQPSPPSSLATEVIQLATFFAATAGLLLLYDRTARDNVAELAQLRRLLSMCAWCRRIRDEKQGWVDVEHYVATHVSRLTHGICPDCVSHHFGARGDDS